jgi:hypothetical protein
LVISAHIAGVVLAKASGAFGKMRIRGSLALHVPPLDGAADPLARGIVLLMKLLKSGFGHVFPFSAM